VGGTTRVGLWFCPMEYIRVMSKQLARALNGCSLLGNKGIGNITKVQIVSRGDGSTHSRSSGEIEDLLEVKAFVNHYQGN